LQAHSKAKQVDQRSNYILLLKELAKIKLRHIKKVSKAHLQLEIRKLQISLLAQLFIIGKLIMNA
jgi:hypothetical protein